MEFDHLKAFVDQHDNFEIRVISHAGSRYYQVELEDVEGKRHMLTQRGKPMMFRDLDDIYLGLKRAGINRAYLVHYVGYDELTGSEAYYLDAPGARMSLEF